MSTLGGGGGCVRDGAASRLLRDDISLTLTINHERTVAVQTWTDKRMSEVSLVLNNPVRGD